MYLIRTQGVLAGDHLNIASFLVIREMFKAQFAWL